MIERVLFKALNAGIEAVTKDLSIIDLLFADYHGLDPSEVAAIRTLWSAKPPKVRHGYAPVDETFPLYTITLQNEGEDETFLGDDVGTIGDDDEDKDDPNFGADIKGSFWRHSYQVMVYAEHPDVCLYLYEIAKSILLQSASGKLLQAEGVHAMRLNGNDLIPDPRFIPEHLFVRVLSVEVKREFQRVDLSSKLGKAYKVSGLHVDNGGSPSDVGGVSTKVKTYTED